MWNEQRSQPRLRWCQFNSNIEPCFPDKPGPATFPWSDDRKPEAEHVRDRHPTAWFFIERGGVVPL